MVERELMRFITSESEKPEMLESFAKEYAAAEGLNPDLLAVSTGEGEKPEQKRDSGRFDGKFYRRHN